MYKIMKLPVFLKFIRREGFCHILIYNYGIGKDQKRCVWRYSENDPVCKLSSETAPEFS